jgi:hypothetical protein
MRNSMADNASRSPRGTQWQERTGTVAPLARGEVSPDELFAVVAVVAILAAAGADGSAGQTERHGSRRYPPSQWNSPGRMLRMTHVHGPGGWRASAFAD